MSKSLSKLLFILSLVFVVQSLFLMQVFASETEEATYCEYDDYKGQGCEFNLSSRTCYYCNEKHKLSHNYTKYTYSSNEDQHEVQCSREKNGAQCSATTWYDHTTSSSSYTYKKDDYYHYVSCDVCGRTCEEEYHTISDGTMSSESYHKGTCSDCGATDVYGEHNTSGGFVKYHNATHHYMKCSSCGYKEVDDPHNRSSVLDTSKTDDTYHYYKCKETSCTGHVSEKHTKEHLIQAKRMLHTIIISVL